MAKDHSNLSNGQWQIFPEDQSAMKSWCYGGKRFFATLLVDYKSLWHLWVTAACGGNNAKKLRAEIRLSSNLEPDCNDVFYRPVQHYESIVLDECTILDVMDEKYMSCLHLYGKVVGKHIKEDAPTELRVGTDIPFTINIFEKVFLDEEKTKDGKWKRRTTLI